MRCSCGSLGSTAQPQWKTILATDYSRVQIDQTSQYAPEMEIAEEIGSGRFQVFRFSLDRLKVTDGYLVNERYAKDWPHPVHQYEEWFARDLDQVANSVGATKKSLIRGLCAIDPRTRAAAYEAIGGYHGYMNLDQYPLEMDEDELDARWGK